MAAVTDKAQLFALRPLRTDVVEFEGAQIPVRELTGTERDAINQYLSAENRNIWEINARVAIAGCDLLEESDLARLMEGSTDLVLAICDKITALSGMDEDAVDDAKKS